jgi:hypothetical protein
MKYKHLAFILAIASLSLPALYNAAYAESNTSQPSSAAPAPSADTAAEGDELKMFRFYLRTDRLDFVKEAMALNPEQENKFLPQYDRYDIELNKLNDERVAIIKDYAANFEKITDKEADKLVKRSFNFRKQRNALLEKYYGKIAKATSKVIAARFLQVESVLQGASDVAIGSSIPLMQK